MYIYIYIYIINQPKDTCPKIVAEVGMAGAQRGRNTAANHGLVHPVSVRRFPSFRTQPLESLSHYL